MIEMRWLVRPRDLGDLGSMPGILQWREVVPRHEGPNAPVRVIRDWTDVPMVKEEAYVTPDSE